MSQAPPAADGNRRAELIRVSARLFRERGFVMEEGLTASCCSI